MRRSKLLLAVLTTGVVATACGAGATDGAVTTATPTATGTAAGPPPPSPSPSPAPASPPTIEAVRVEIADGRVVGGASRIEAAIGEEVTIVVSSDVADTVHLHGYDVQVPVAPGQPATLTVTADIPGAFEIELEGAGLKIAELAVSG